MKNTDLSDKIGCIGVLMGGYSSEREISIKSGYAIFDALQQLGFDVQIVDIIEKDLSKVWTQIKDSEIDLAFIALHGQLGEDGDIQSILEDLNIPFTGSTADSNKSTFNKAITQNILKSHNINIPDFISISNLEEVSYDQVTREVQSYPVVVKPACEGSSIGITLVNSKDQLADAMNLAWEYGDTLLIEQFIQGKELTVGILGEEALPVVEIRPKGQFFDYEAKYTKGKTEYIVPADVNNELAKKLQEMALKTHQVLGCTDLSRVDFIVDELNQPYVLEINTVPGFTQTSLLPMAAQQNGLNFNKLCKKILEMAYGKKKKTKDITVGN